mmetsp:Transcript_49412/g.82234  ORF Transcript_49412/g.82234 Transcript_49412/m.82234 type:complete len:240 (-) Transcript_49412:1601-2320(-)
MNIRVLHWLHLMLLGHFGVSKRLTIVLNVLLIIVMSAIRRQRVRRLQLIRQRVKLIGKVIIPGIQRITQIRCLLKRRSKTGWRCRLRSTNLRLCLFRDSLPPYRSHSIRAKMTLQIVLQSNLIHNAMLFDLHGFYARQIRLFNHGRHIRLVLDPHIRVVLPLPHKCACLCIGRNFLGDIAICKQRALLDVLLVEEAFRSPLLLNNQVEIIAFKHIDGLRTIHSAFLIQRQRLLEQLRCG